jgi:hypothetical protein
VSASTGLSRRKEVSGMQRRFLGGFVALLGLVVLAGCSKSGGGGLVANQRPTISVTSGPINGTDNFYDVKLDWYAFDPDGQIVKYIYAVDPPVSGDTAWVETKASEVDLFFDSTKPPNPLPALGSLITERSFHTWVIKAIDNLGLASAPVFRSFNSHTTAPSTQILIPQPTREVAVATVPSVTISWTGTDPDGVIKQKPVKYKFKLVKASDISPTNPNAIPIDTVQVFFGKDADNFFASWDSVSGDTTSRFYQGLTPTTTYYFAIVAFDEAGAYEPRFNLDSNVLQFRPTLNRLGPVVTVFNQFFAKTQNAGGISLEPSRIYPFQFPADNPITFNWSAVPGSVGSVITGYRWTLDIEGADIANETPRHDESDFQHWSTWSLNEQSAVIGPFAGSLDTTVTHFFYVEARDNLGFVSLFTIQLGIVKPNFARSLKVVDDMYGILLRQDNTRVPQISLPNRYPVEAEQDSFYYAVGGFPDSLKILSGTPGAISTPGCFAGFDYDTTDYKYYPAEGFLLSDLGKYRVIAWYSDQSSAAQKDAKFGGNQPMTALRFINTIGHLNSLAVYLTQGGKLWLFGDGTTTCIADGYFSRISPTAVPKLPYTSGDDPRTNILRPGDFLYDFCHLQSEVNLPDPAFNNFTIQAAMKSCIPYLPQYALPPGQTEPADRSLDPHIGPSAARNLVRWPNLPRLTLGAYRTLNADPALRIERQCFVVSKPLFVSEGTGANFQSVLDTMYLYQAATYDPNNVQVPTADGYPCAVDYHGSQHGEVIWMGFPLYFFEQAQARTLTSQVLTQLGVPLAPAGRAGAHADPGEKGGAIVVRSPRSVTPSSVAMGRTAR